MSTEHYQQLKHYSKQQQKGQKVLGGHDVGKKMPRHNKKNLLQKQKGLRIRAKVEEPRMLCRLMSCGCTRIELFKGKKNRVIALRFLQLLI